MNKLKEYTELFNNEIKVHQNEIENFESHLLQEHKNFSNFFQDKISNSENNYKQFDSFKENFINQINSILNNMKEENYDLIFKINDSINQLNKNQNKKIDSLLKILMNNNLIPIDFDYNTFCSLNENNFKLEDIQPSSYRNNNESNTEYNLKNSP